MDMSETKIIMCRFCQTHNKIPLASLFTQLQTAKCGRCHENLFFSEEQKLTGLCSQHYEHPSDRQALDTVKKIPGIETVLKTLIKESYERAHRLYLKANTVAVTSRQLPTLQQMLLEAAFRLDLATVPDLFVTHAEEANAYTTGVEKPVMVLTSGLLELLTNEEVFFVLGHELGHWQAGHVLYKMASQLLSTATSALAELTLGVGRLLTTPLQLALLQWDRCSELTADRAGLLAVRRVEVAIQTLMKLAGGSRVIYEQMDYQEFLRQAEEFHLDQEDSTLNKFYITLQTLYRSHPFPVGRASEILAWAKQGAYLDLLAGRETFTTAS
jgi:Zn-dependent protease with chaperone function